MSRHVITERSNKIIYKEDGNVYKLFEEGYNRADILNEALNQARVEETGLNIPKLVEVRKIGEQWALVTEYVAGKTMKELLDENPDREDELLERFVDIQIEMQSKRCPLLNKHRDKMNRKIGETNLAATLRYDLHTRIEGMPRHNQLCHGDYNPSNVIITDDNEAYILDWSHATQGNGEADAARTFLLFLLENEQERGKKYLTEYCRKTGCNYMDVLNWIPILAASQSVKNIDRQMDTLSNLITLDEKELRKLYD